MRKDMSSDAHTKRRLWCTDYKILHENLGSSYNLTSLFMKENKVSDVFSELYHSNSKRTMNTYTSLLVRNIYCAYIYFYLKHTCLASVEKERYFIYFLPRFNRTNNAKCFARAKFDSHEFVSWSQFTRLSSRKI